ncbi:MAG: DUF2064 domain-containing protein [Sphingobacteriales bacterium]|nr:DUF2064 domain-containing protein [Sphingobacteriales bacterium]
MPKLLKNCLIVFARNPVLGKVKTRIAATQDIHKALQVYKTLLDYTLNMVAECNFIDTRLLCFAGGFPNQALPQPPFALAQQIPNPNLGARMQAAFEQAFAPNNQHQRVCIIGSDCPYLTPNHLQLAFKALLTHKAVIGPPPMAVIIYWASTAVCQQNSWRFYLIIYRGAQLSFLSKPYCGSNS